MAQASPATGQRLRNFVIVLVAIFLGLSIYIGSGSQNNPATLAYQAENSTPWEQAQTNGKPTLLEFYANWCSSCRAMAADIGTLKQEFQDQVNFVMLNVDNDKWLPEMIKYNVDGIPHLVFLNPQAEVVGMAIGQQPLKVMTKNLTALVNGQSLDSSQALGETSALKATLGPKTDDPRSHGGLPRS